MNIKYTNDQKKIIVERHITGGESVAAIVADTNIPRSTLYLWIKQYYEKTLGKKEWSPSYQIRFLENKVKRLEEIITILKTVNCSVKDPLKIKLQALEELYGQYSVHVLCDALEVSRGTFYNFMFRNKRDNTWYDKHREELRQKIQEIYDESNQIFGATKIVAVLKERGYSTSIKMVRELMRDMGLTSIRQDAKDLYDKEQRKFKNYLNQQFDTTAPNQVWVSDVTYFRFNHKNFYICAIIDLYSRFVVGYKIGEKNSTQLVKSTFKLAYEKRNPGNNLIFHTDRGSNYKSKTMCQYLKALNVRQSFSRAHIPYDNSVMESFFSSLKREELYRTKYRSEYEFRTSVDNYIVFYNERRPHAKNGYKTPLKKEQDYYSNMEIL